MERKLLTPAQTTHSNATLVPQSTNDNPRPIVATSSHTDTQSVATHTVTTDQERAVASDCSDSSESDILE